MLTLMVMAVLGGSMLSWVLFPTPEMICLPMIMKTLALSVSIIGGWMGYELSKFSLAYRLQSLNFYLLASFMGSMWFMPFISTYGVNKVPMLMGDKVFKVFDQGWSEEFGGQNIYNFSVDYSSLIQWWQNNDLKIYLISFIFWVVILIVFMLY